MQVLSKLSASQRMVLVIMLSLVIWGIYLAIGATGVFVESSLLDARKSGIVIFFVALFLGLWGVVLKGGSQTKREIAGLGTSPASRSRPWNVAGLMTVGLTCLGIVCWVGAVFSWESADLRTTTLLGWAAALLLLGSVTAGIVALSDRTRKRGKWLGFVGLIACLFAVITFIGRMAS